MAKRAFTLVELLVVISIILVLVAILVPVISGSLTEARKTGCQTNLSAISKAVGGWQATSSYAAGGKTAFPLVFAAGSPNSTATSTSNDVNTLDSSKPNAMQNIWRLIAEGYIQDIAFHCPSDGGWAQRTSTDKYGWVSRSNFSYGVQWPYDSEVAGTAPLNAAPPTSNSLAPGLVVMADRNPYKADGTDNVDARHHKDGVSVMTADRNVYFYKFGAVATPYNVGFKTDNIYKNATAATAGGIPQTATDTSITPWPSR